MQITSKLPEVGQTIFTTMSALAAEHDAINLSQGFPNFDVDPRLQERVAYHIRSGANQYAPMAGIPQLREAIARKVALLYQANVDPDTEITITSGATEAIYSAISALIHQGDEVIVFEPAYDSYVPSITINGGTVVPIRLESPSFSIDWDLVRSKITDRTRLIMINTPHNPTGSILTASDLHQLRSITEDTKIMILSDEVYQHLIYDGHRHESVLQYQDLYQRSIITMSFGKTFHATGWRIGYVIAPRDISLEIRKVHQYNTFSINRPIQHALADYLTDSATYLQLPSFYQAKRDLFLEAMTDSRFDLMPCLGTYFVLARYDRISQRGDQEFAREMTRDHGVAVIPMSSFYTEAPEINMIRFCFAKTDNLLLKAASLLCTI